MHHPSYPYRDRAIFILLLTLLLASASVPTVAQERNQEKYHEPELTPDGRAHWAFQKPSRPRVPDLTGQPEAARWVRNPVDAFVLARLQAAQLRPSPEADRLTLIRRVTLDLTGLPPTPSDVEAFLKDDSPDAYEKLVERLLASPHFGERWAQHWLDVVRFAESNGYEVDAERPQAWRYRDYVVKSFNDDKPYDQFITEQLAGDELAAGKPARDVADLWIATGMHRCGPVHVVSGNLDAAVLRQERLTEMVNGIGAAFLGLTVGCARCHDHKFDPFSAADYYRLQAFFAAAEYAEVDISTEAERQERQERAAPIAAEIASIKAKVAALDAPYREAIGKAKREKLEPKYQQALATPAEKRTPEQKKLAAEAATLTKVTWEEVHAALTPEDRDRRAKLRERQHALEAQMPPPHPAAWAIKPGDDTPPTHVLKRGDPNRKALVVRPGFPRVLLDTTEEPKTRLDLARWLTRPEHPLTARVIVNRLWQHHFGTGIVSTPNDFGTRGAAPSHPELLDWLAAELVNPTWMPTDRIARPRPWSLKHIHRLIVTSATYRQASDTRHGTPTDPQNSLLWRMNRRRLEAEAVRDAILAVAGTLNPAVGGRSVKVPLEPEVYDLIFTEGEPDGLWPVTPDKTQHTRRSIYLFSKRNVRLPLLEAFDQPDTLNSCAARPVSTFAPQALILMNGPFVREQGQALAERLVKDCGPDTDRQIRGLYHRAFGRDPWPEEHKLTSEFLKAQTATIRDASRHGRANAPGTRALPEQARLPVHVILGGVSIVLDPHTFPPGADPALASALADLCVVIFNTHEFVYIP
jgi:hypothetical protein